MGSPRGRSRRHSVYRDGGGPGFRGALTALFLLIIVAGAVVIVLSIRSSEDAKDDRKAAAQRFAVAWIKGERATMYEQLTPAAQRERTRADFTSAYDRAYKEATVERVRIGRLGSEGDERIAVPVTITTKDYGTLRGVVNLRVGGSGDDAGIVWNPSMRLPGLRDGEAVRTKEGEPPTRADILDAGGRLLESTGLGASIAGEAEGDKGKPTGLNRIYDERLAGKPSRRLLFGDRTIKRLKAVSGKNLRSTIKLGLTAKANEALGDRNGGIAVIRPKDGAVLALAGLAVSAPQPPGSTFKIITLAAALEEGTVKPSTTFPVQTSTTLTGVRLGNANGESCGGSLTASFSESCNSVFAPMGAKLGADKLVSYAEKFGFNEQPKLPASKPSTIAKDLRDDIAVGSAAIGQERDLATPLEMASVGATIARDGTRVRPRIATIDPIVTRKVVSERTAHRVRDMMVSVVSSGTGTAAGLPGVQVAGKTGTAELKENSKAAQDANAWFVAFAPARKPKVAVAVMLIGGGFGGDTAAPIAKRVLQAALDR